MADHSSRATETILQERTSSYSPGDNQDMIHSRTALCFSYEESMREIHGLFLGLR